MIIASFTSEPRSSAPKFLERAALVTLQPPAAEEELKDNETCAKQEACRMSEMSE